MDPSQVTNPSAMLSTPGQVPTTQAAMVASAASPTAANAAATAANAATDPTVASTLTVAATPSEPLLLPADFIAGAAGLLLSGSRNLLWGLTLVDVIGRQVSATYRQYAYQYVHIPLGNMLPASLSGLGGVGALAGARARAGLGRFGNASNYVRGGTQYRF